MGAVSCAVVGNARYFDVHPFYQEVKLERILMTASSISGTVAVPFSIKSTLFGASRKSRDTVGLPIGIFLLEIFVEAIQCCLSHGSRCFAQFRRVSEFANSIGLYTGHPEQLGEALQETRIHDVKEESVIEKEHAANE
jgi:hypothetical protein